MAGELAEDVVQSRWKTWLSASWRRWIGRVVATLLLLTVALGIAIDTPFGHRLVASYIAGLKPQSGLRIKIGEITGSLYGRAELRDVTLADPQGEFLQVPLTDLDWRPLNWFTYGLDIRQLAFRQGTLSRFPEFEPGDPDSPLLPDFNIRVDRFAIDRLEVAEGLAGERREVSFFADARIDDGIVRLKADGELGGTDRLAAQLEARPDADRFVLAFEYNAPAGGLLAGLTGANEDWHASASGEGGWNVWSGDLAVQRADEKFATLQLSNRAGLYGAKGQVRPNGVFEGVTARAAGDAVSLGIEGRFEDSTFAGDILLESTALQARGSGSIDLSDNRFDRVAVALTLLDRGFFGEDVILEGARATATIDGRFSALVVDHQVEIARGVFGQAGFEQISQQGAARREGDEWKIELDADVARSRTGYDDVDRILANAHLGGTLQVQGSSLRSDRLVLNSSVLAAQFALDADLAQADYAVSGSADFARLDMPEFGRFDVRSNFAFRAAGNSRWAVTARISGQTSNIKNGLIEQFAGSDLAFGGSFSAGSDRPVAFADARLSGEHLDLAFDARLDGDRLEISGAGEHRNYGPLRFAGSRHGEQIEADITLDRPFDPAGLEDVGIELASIEGGFGIVTSGQSRLGPFDGRLRLLLPEGEAPQLAMDRLDIWRTRLSGLVRIQDGLLLGEIGMAGGGIEGSVELVRAAGDTQGYMADITARNARFGGMEQLSIAQADIALEGDFASEGRRFQAMFDAQGIGYGEFFIGRLAGQANLTGGRGRAALLLVGRSGSDFELQFEARVQPDRAIVQARGHYRDERIAMARPATVIWQDDGAWRVEPFQLNLDGGLLFAVAQGAGDGSMQGRVRLNDVPLADIGMIRPGTGMTGNLSGSLNWSTSSNGVPTAAMEVKLTDFSRSGLTLSSQPVDIVASAALSEQRLRINASAEASEGEVGRLSMSISRLPANGSLLDRLYDGQLAGELQFDGPASVIWRLAQLDTFDVTGPLSVRAKLAGKLSEPSISGPLQGDGMRLNSGVTGTDIANISMRGRFAGPNLQLTSFSGTTPGNGRVSGSGTIGFANLLERGPTIDIRIAASQAQLLERSDISATLTGPIRILSDGSGGTIAGRVQIDKGRWRLGRADAAEALPVIETVEVNLPSSRAPANTNRVTWRYLVDARARNQLQVEGMGLDSEWSADVRLRGTVDDPRIGGKAELVRGDFAFAGSNFGLERGDIRFDEMIEPDPVLDIAAHSKIGELDVTVTVTGRATAPQIDLRSTPRLPEDELLSRILFGGPLNELSPLNALQLGSAVASLRSGGGLRPINGLRQAAGLDNLRLLAPDPSINRGTAIAAGRYFTRRIYAELITDGQGYTATQLEFRLTSWLKLLASVSSLSRERVTLEYRKDY
jgi:translocation and assembly module TamB